MNHAATAGHPALDGVTLDLGVSSMQLDRAERGFSFLRDGPLGHAHGAGGAESAADLVNDAPEALLADIIHYYGEERAARRIARAIVAERAKGPSTPPCNWRARRGLPAAQEAGAEPSRDPHLPGAPHRRE
jgi:16S rRNA (cytosine1402-N4)-methyltransferase